MPGIVNYGDALELQRRLQSLRQSGTIGDTLVLLEHPPVLTLGVRGNRDNIVISSDYAREHGITIHEVERGGDVTYHGPGQIVGYPIIDLNGYNRDIKAFVNNIEEIFISLLSEEYGIKARRDDKKYTGVWVGNDKITAIGISVRKWVTMHGFAFNVNTDLDHFKWIVPCGLSDRGITSLQKLKGTSLDIGQVCSMVARYYCRIFDTEPVLQSGLADFISRNEIIDQTVLIKAGLTQPGLTLPGSTKTGLTQSEQ